MPGPGNAPRPLRALIVHDSLAENGGVRLTLDVAERFVGMGAAAEIFAVQPVRAGPEARVPAGVALRRGVPVGGRLRSSGLGAAVRLVRAARGAHVVVSGSEVGLGLLLGRAAARLARRPFAVVVHAPLDRVVAVWVSPRLRRPTRRAHRRADAAICVAASLVEGVVANGLDRERVHVVPNGVDVERVRRLAAAGPRTARGAPTVVGLGRLSEEKAFDLLVRAHAEVRRAGIAHELELIGEGPERGRLVRLAAELGVADSVSLPGFLENPYPRLARAAVLAVPSRHEGLPLSLLEAVALEVPVIATRSAAVAWDLLGAEIGELVDDESVPALADALRRHLEAPERLRAAARAASAVLGAHTLDRAARDHLRVLELTVRRRAARGRPEAAYE